MPLRISPLMLIRKQHLQGQTASGHGLATPVLQPLGRCHHLLYLHLHKDMCPLSPIAVAVAKAAAARAMAIAPAVIAVATAAVERAAARAMAMVAAAMAVATAAVERTCSKVKALTTMTVLKDIR